MVLAVFLFSGCSSSSEDAYREEIVKLRKEKNKKFAHASESPLLKEDVDHFVGLQYFPVDSTYRLQAKFSPAPHKKTIEMPTTTDRTPLYYTLGTAEFSIKDTLCRLVIYQEVEDSTELFIPFNDYTNGAESYGGGRYLDLELKDINEGTILLDFNKTYNPYCAYNYKFSCPIPPDTNMLNIAIRAGEKSYKH